MAGECNTVNYCLHIRTHKQTRIYTSAEIWMFSPITQMIWTLTRSDSESLGTIFSAVLSGINMCFKVRKYPMNTGATVTKCSFGYTKYSVT